MVAGLASTGCFVDAPPDGGSGTADAAGSDATASSATSVAAGSDGTSAATAGPSCAELTCDPNATCVERGTATCVCNEGYEGDGLSCAPLVTCADAPCAEGVCVDTPNGFQCAHPATCAELLALLGDAGDGEYTLYLAGDPLRPWTAYCHDMQGAPREYLTLPAQLEGVNISRYVADDDKVVTSTYARIRLAPDTLLVDISDATFANNAGLALHSGAAVASVWFGVAMTCNTSVTAANVDLSGTPFEIAGEFCGEGFDFKGEVMSPSAQTREITGGGNCGWYSPGIDGCPFNPINNDPVKPGEGEQLLLAYAPG